MATIDLYTRFRSLGLSAKISVGKASTNYSVEIFSHGKQVTSFTLAKYLGAGYIVVTIDHVDCVAYITSASRNRNVNSFVADYSVMLYGISHYVGKEAVRDLNNWHAIGSVIQPTDCTVPGKKTATTTTTTAKKKPVVWTFIREYRGAKLYHSDDKRSSKWEAEGIEYINHSSQTLVETYVCSPLNVDCLSIQQVKDELEIAVPFYTDLKHIEAERTVVAEFRKITAKASNMVTMAKELLGICLAVLPDEDVSEVYERIEMLKSPGNLPVTPNSSSIIHLPDGTKI